MGYDSNQLAHLFGRPEAEIVEGLHRARAQDKLAGLPDRQEDRQAGEVHGEAECVGKDRST